MRRQGRLCSGKGRRAAGLRLRRPTSQSPATSPALSPDRRHPSVPPSAPPGSGQRRPNRAMRFDERLKPPGVAPRRGGAHGPRGLPPSARQAELVRPERPTNECCVAAHLTIREAGQPTKQIQRYSPSHESRIFYIYLARRQDPTAEWHGGRPIGVAHSVRSFLFF